VRGHQSGENENVNEKDKDKDKDKDKSNGHPNVLTLVMLGTTHHSGKLENILTEFHRSVVTDESHFSYLIEGVAGTASTKEMEKSPMLGTYDVTGVLLHPDGSIEGRKELRDKSNRVLEKQAMITGAGSDDAIHEALLIINTLIANNKIPLVINMAGFSRGADTLLRLSNILNDIYPKEIVSINIFAIDPVPGPMRQESKKAFLVPPNVNTYEAVYMNHEENIALRVQDQSRLMVENTKETKMISHLYHGVHESGLRFIGDPNDPNNPRAHTQDAARLVWDDLRKFAHQHQTLLHKDGLKYIERQIINDKKNYVPHESHELSNEERLQAYTRMVMYEKEYAKLGFPGSKRAHNTHKEDYFLHGTNYFIDFQHMRLFEQMYPRIFDYFFQQNTEFGIKKDEWNPEYYSNPEYAIEKDEWNNVELCKELKKLLSDDPMLATTLNVKLKLDPPITMNQTVLAPTQGIPVGTILYSNTKLMRRWDAIKALTQAVYRGYDKSVDPKIASQLYRSTYAILVSDLKDNHKKTMIDKLMLETYFHYATNDNLYFNKLAAVIRSHQKLPEKIPNAINRFIDFVRQQLDQYKAKNDYYMINKSQSWFDFFGLRKEIDPLILAKVNIAIEINKQLSHLRETNADIHAVITVLNNALHMSYEVNRKYEIDSISNKQFTATEFDSILRRCIIDITVPAHGVHHANRVKKVEIDKDNMSYRGFTLVGDDQSSSPHGTRTATMNTTTTTPTIAAPAITTTTTTTPTITATSTNQTNSTTTTTTATPTRRK